jgi:predicted phosphate transport protein (TIGR00153 family)
LVFGAGRRFRLIGNREQTVLDLMNEHLDLVAKAVSFLKDGVTMAMTGQKSVLVETKIGLVSDYENLADDAHLKAMLEVCKGAFYTGLREDFLSLFEKVDDIADYAKDAAQILKRNINEFLSLQVFGKDEEVSPRAFMDKIEEAVAALKEAVNNLGNDVTKSIEKILEVKRWEHEADNIKSKLIDRLYEHRKDLDLLVLLDMKDFIFILDNVADAAEQSSEIIMAIVAKARG